MPEKNFPRGSDLLHNPVLNKGSAFTAAERDALGLRGLLPPRAQTQAEQVERVLGNLACKSTDLERYIALIALAGRNQTLFYRVLIDQIEQLMPIVYTPTVGEACQQYDRISGAGRALHFCGRPGSRGGGLAEVAGARRARDRGDRWRADSRPRRPGERLHGDTVGKLMLSRPAPGCIRRSAWR